MREKMQISKRVTKKGLEVLAAVTDASLYALSYAPSEELEKRKFARDFSVMHYYFIQLTLRALDDRKLAEQLIPLFTQLEERMIEYRSCFSTFSQFLQLKHGIKGKSPPPASPEKIERAMERWMRRASYEEIMAHHESIRRRELDIRKEEKDATATKDENIMFR